MDRRWRPRQLLPTGCLLRDARRDRNIRGAVPRVTRPMPMVPAASGLWLTTQSHSLGHKGCLTFSGDAI